MIERGSRYEHTPVRTYVTATGREIPYLGARRPAEQPVAGGHLVREGDRADRLAAEHLGDPLQSWRLWDAAGVLRPSELTATVGRRIPVPGPPIPGQGG